MTRVLVALLFALCAGGFALPTRANTCTVPNTLTNGQVVDANILNTNFVALQSCGNNIDSTNIGPAGILASSIISTSAASGTFGGTVGFQFTSKITTMTPLTINGITGQSADILDINATTGGTKLLYVDAAGLIHTLSGYFGSSASNIAIGTGFVNGIPSLTNSSDGGINFDISSSSTNAYRFFSGTAPTQLAAISSTGLFSANSAAFVGGVSLSGMNSTGPIAASSTSSGTQGFVGPSYALNGASAPSTQHHVNATVGATITAACAVGASCSVSGSATFGAQAAWTSSTSYNCTLTTALDLYAGAPGLIWTANRVSATQVNFGLTNANNVTAPSGATVYANMICDGY